MFRPRQKQEEILSYPGGSMGVAAVPGSGKTHTLSYLAAMLVASADLGSDQEVLIVTLVNSAVDNFRQRVAGFMQEMGLIPDLGYRVRTLHGLAHDIVRERPGLVGLSDDFEIVDERITNGLLNAAAQAWLRSNPGAIINDYISPQVEDNKVDWIQGDRWPELARNISGNFIRRAKDLRLTPQDIERRLDNIPVKLPLADMGLQVYQDYQRALAYRGAVDYDDLIRLAIQALELDPGYLQLLKERWPYILEDEAQDSSRLQEDILRLLTEPDGNWVRVGDPNQAIFETFTTADPQYLRDFIAVADYPRDLPNSGRSTLSIIALANHLTEWTQREHPIEALRDALNPPAIQPTPAGDPQPNPSDEQTVVRIISKGYSPQEELTAVVESVSKWLPDHPNETVAILVPRNQRGFDVTAALGERGIDYVEILQSTTSTRLTAGALATIIAYLADPLHPKKLSRAFRAWRRGDREDPEASDRVDILAKSLQGCRQVEDYLWPDPGKDWVDTRSSDEEDPTHAELLLGFREITKRWSQATLLPIDQLILTIAQDVFTEPGELALAHKLAGLLRQIAENHPAWGLPELNDELALIAKNERRFLGFSQDDTGFDPERHKGIVVVSTMHKAKGLEWDRVYLMSVNNYNFPSAQEFDRYIAEPWFIRDQLNLEAEALSQLDALVSQDEHEWYKEGDATRNARLDYAAERLRLLYVCITRAKRELIITWNNGRRGDLHPALPLVALQTFLEESQDHGSTD